MSSLKDNKSCVLVEQYLSYLTVVKGRSLLTAEEYRVDILMLLEFIKRKKVYTIISIRQFWKYLKTKAHLLSNNIAEKLESPKLPQRMPKYLTLEESIRLLIESEKSPRDYCILL